MGEITLTKKIILYRSALTELLDETALGELDETVIGERPYTFLQGLPTKQDIREQETLAEMLAFGALGIMCLRPVSYRNEYDGNIVHDIMPQPGKEEEASSSGRAPLPLHTDMAFLRFPGESRHPFRAAAPDFLLLSGVVNSPHVTTRIVTLKEALTELGDNQLRLLSEPLFDIESPATVKPKRVAEGVPLLFHHPSYGLMLRFNNAGKKIVGTTPETQRALDDLACIVNMKNLGIEVDIQPGSVFIFNNRQVLHGRGGINTEKGSTAAKDRHFKRIYGQRIETETNPVFQTNPFMQAL
jgi:L-asparagine oxygenase